MLQNLNKIKFRLLVVFALAAIYLRFKGIEYGLPNILNPNEADYLLKPIVFFKNPFRYFLSSESIEMAPIWLFFNGIILFISNLTLDINTLISALEISPETLYMPLRFFSILFSIGSVIVTYFIGLEFSFPVALLSGGLASVSLIGVKFAKEALCVSPIAFFSILSVYFALQAQKNTTSLNKSILAAFISSLIFPIGLISLAPSFYLILNNKEISAYKCLLRNYLIAFLIFNFHLFIHPMALLKKLATDYVNGYFYYHSSASFLHIILFPITGVGALTLFLAACLLFYYRNIKLDLLKLKLLFVFPLFAIGIFSLFHLTEVKYFSFLYPYFCLSAALALSFLDEKFHVTYNKQFLFIVLVLLTLWLPLKNSLKYNKLISLSDTRQDAVAWIKQNTSENYKISWDKHSLQLNWYDAYNKSLLNLLVQEPEALINRQRYPITKKLIQSKNWIKTLKRKVDYVLINSIDYESALRARNVLSTKYYKKILKLEAEIVFNPYLQDLDKKPRRLLMEELYSPFLTLWQRERCGPVIKVYKL